MATIEWVRPIPGTVGIINYQNNLVPHLERDPKGPRTFGTTQGSLWDITTTTEATSLRDGTIFNWKGAGWRFHPLRVVNGTELRALKGHYQAVIPYVPTTKRISVSLATNSPFIWILDHQLETGAWRVHQLGHSRNDTLAEDYNFILLPTQEHSLWII